MSATKIAKLDAHCFKISTGLESIKYVIWCRSNAKSHINCTVNPWIALILEAKTCCTIQIHNTQVLLIGALKTLHDVEVYVHANYIRGVLKIFLHHTKDRTIQGFTVITF